MGNYQSGIKVSIITIIINAILSIAKIIIGIIGHSSAMLADGFHTLSDILTTVVVLAGLKVSSREADQNHPYGHEKYEPVFAKIVSIFLILTGIFIGYGGLRILISGHIIVPGKITLVAALVSIIVKESMFRYTMRAANRIKSFAMKADAWHHRSDAMSSVGTFLGILGARMGIIVLDPIAAMVVGVFIIRVGVNLYLQSIRGLVDEAADEEIILKIKSLAVSIEGVNGIKDLKTRIFGNKIYVDIDILVKGNLSVTEGHEIAKRVHDLIENTIGDIKHCMVHVEPEISDII